MIKLFKKYKKINESPDIVISSNNVVRYNQNDARAFGYFFGKIQLTDYGEAHNDIEVEKEDFPEYTESFYNEHNKFKFTKYDDSIWRGKIGLRREFLTYPGRIWENSKIISFWEYPKDQKELRKILNDIEVKSLSSSKIEIGDDWKIETLNKIDKVKDIKFDVKDIIFDEEDFGAPISIKIDYDINEDDFIGFNFCSDGSPLDTISGIINQEVYNKNTLKFDYIYKHAYSDEKNYERLKEFLSKFANTSITLLLKSTNSSPLITGVDLRNHESWTEKNLLKNGLYTKLVHVDEYVGSAELDKKLVNDIEHVKSPMKSKRRNKINLRDRLFKEFKNLSKKISEDGEDATYNDKGRLKELKKELDKLNNELVPSGIGSKKVPEDKDKNITMAEYRAKKYQESFISNFDLFEKIVLDKKEKIFELPYELEEIFVKENTIELRTKNGIFSGLIERLEEKDNIYRVSYFKNKKYIDKTFTDNMLSGKVELSKILVNLNKNV